MLRRIYNAAAYRVHAALAPSGLVHRGRLLESGIHRLKMPLPPDDERGWKAYPQFKGRTRNKISLSCHVSVLTKGNRPHPPHTHNDEEILMVLAGEADLVLPRYAGNGNDHRMRLRAGEFVYYPAFFPHTLECVSGDPTNYLMFKWSSNRQPAAEPLSFAHFEIAEPEIKETTKNGFHSSLLFQGPTRHLRKLHCHVTLLEPGGGYDPHVDAHDVAIIMLEGECETLGRRFTPHDVIFYAAGEFHGIYNPNDTIAKYVVFEFHGGYKPFRWINKLRRRH